MTASGNAVPQGTLPVRMSELLCGSLTIIALSHSSELK